MENSLKHLADRLHASPSSDAALINQALSVGAPHEVVLPSLLTSVLSAHLQSKLPPPMPWNAQPMQPVAGLYSKPNKLNTEPCCWLKHMQAKALKDLPINQTVYLQKQQRQKSGRGASCTGQEGCGANSLERHQC